MPRISVHTAANFDDLFDSIAGLTATAEAFSHTGHLAGDEVTPSELRELLQRHDDGLVRLVRDADTPVQANAQDFVTSFGTNVFAITWRDDLCWGVGHMRREWASYVADVVGRQS